MAVTYYVKRGDTSPAVTDTLEDSSGTAVNLTSATVKFAMTTFTGTVIVNGTATGPNGGALDNTGQVQYQWVSADTASAGQYWAEWQVTFSNGQIETWPNNDQAIVNITPDLI
jgi:hypothetical protein